ncbi:MAG: hypothetical protein GXO62_03095 [Epsilonproteobacteria bacterium]|nr:hypothetical protein [Campylobacterota bacterium]
MNNKTAFTYAWEFIRSNWILTAMVITILVGIGVLSFIPLIGAIFSILITLIIFNLQIYFGKLVSESQSVEDIKKFSKKTELESFLFKYINIAAGAYLGFFVLFLLVGTIYGLVMAKFGIDYYSGGLTGFGLLWILIGMVIFGIVGYIYPAVMGEILKTGSFMEAFKSVFNLFNPNLWKKSLNKKYFGFVSIWMLLILGLAIMSAVLIILVPVGMFFTLFLSLFSGAAYIIASNLLKEESQTNQNNEEETEQVQES